MTSTAGLPSPKKALVKAINSNWTVTILGGLILTILTPLVTGFVSLTFSTKSWEAFGVSNGVGTPGSYLQADAVYKIPVNERFRVDGDFLLSVGRDSLARPTASLTSAEGREHDRRISASDSLRAESECHNVAVHLMRYPADDASEFFIMYTSKRLNEEGCEGFWSRIFG